MPKQLLVTFTPIRSCLVHLPSPWANALLDQGKLPQNVMVELSWLNQSTIQKAYCGWSGEASKALDPNAVFKYGNSPPEVLAIDPQFGQAIGLSEGQLVSVEFCRNVPECVSVHVEPHTEDDWEILELHAGYVEDNLLSQIRVVYENQLMCVWIHGRTLVRLRVAEINPPSSYMKLTNNAEVIVAPKARQSTKPADIAASKILSTQQQQGAPHICLRHLSYKLPGSHGVWINPDDSQEHGLVRISKVIPAFASRAQSSEDNSSEPTANKDIRALYAPVTLSTLVPRHHIHIESYLAESLNIKPFDRIKVSTVTAKKTPAAGIILRRLSSPAPANVIKLGLDTSAINAAQQKIERNQALIEAFKAWVQGLDDPIVLTHGMKINLQVNGKPVGCIIQLGPQKGLFSSAQATSEQESYTSFTRAILERSSVTVGDDIPKSPIAKEEHHSPKSKGLTTMGGVDTIYNQLHRYTLANLAERDLKAQLHVPGSGGMLVTGAHGSGKTSLVKKLMEAVHDDPGCLMHTITIQCSELVDERVPVFKDILQKWFDEAAWYAPSILFFDDLDRLIPAEVEHADSTRSRHLAELFSTIARTMTARHPLMIIATSQQQQSLHPTMITHHVFTELRHVNPPTRDERKQIMHAIMSEGSDVLSQSLGNIDLVAVASDTEGYLAADLKALVERTVHESAVRNIRSYDPTNPTATEKIELTQQDFVTARQGFVPSSLRGVKLQSSTVQWTDIGGLHETRKALLETLEWPTKYAAVFSQCPLRLRSGLMLYGYPGCGKTLLASAVAKECGLNFISVKGPEILNKYIGASEKSVRDLFDRAQAAKPCVLFFDEFDSIAPRRGHDSTGVTDRVVNQMLTQMDGAEGLDGVYVLAATSRPDLIDPALLRPGRLDKALLCGMPSFEERLDILEALSHKMTLASDVDLTHYAKNTEGFTGADLQGFFYNAHLEAIHDAMDINSFRQQQKNQGPKEEKNGFVMIGKSTVKAPLTLAEKGQISQRLAMIQQGAKKQETSALENEPKQAVSVSSNHTAAIQQKHLDKSLKSTRPSITADECLRLQMIYDEFVTGRTGELKSGEGAKGVGKRSTLG
ncbi:P-loop containing nucleoside triphosphate hydrolase protein [Phycomyces nitens]|nr:P-loop containing nucleoside triphosphate hydrolase protein [Phycomyces nitens]